MAELARLTGKGDMVRVHVDDQMDSKSLLGAYVCTANPEEFVWQPGPLTQVSTGLLCLSVGNEHQATNKFNEQAQEVNVAMSQMPVVPFNATVCCCRC